MYRTAYQNCLVKCGREPKSRQRHDANQPTTDPPPPPVARRAPTPITITDYSIFESNQLQLQLLRYGN